MNGLEERLRSELARSTASVVPAPDPVDRLLRRRRRQQRWTRIGVAAAAAVALALAGGTAVTVAGSPEPSPGPVGPQYPTGPEHQPDFSGATITPQIRQLIDSPTRGNLAGDAALVAELTEQLRDARSQWLVPATLTQVKVLLLADVGIERVYSAAYYDDDRAVILDSSGYPDTSATDLAHGRYGGGISPAIPFPVNNSTTEPTGEPRYSYVTVLAPAGCTVAAADTFRLSAGQAVPVWTDPGSDYLVRDGDQSRSWWQITCGGVVQSTHRGTLNDPPVGQTPTVPERGHADPAAVRDAFQNWVDLPGPRITAYRALWAGTPPGGTHAVVVVAGQTSEGVEVCAVTASSGLGTAVSSTVAGGPLDDGQAATAGVGSVSTGVAEAADFVAVRLPDDDHPGLLSDRILVLAPPGAREVSVTGSVTATVPLTNGVGVLTAPAPATIELHAGSATARVAEPAGAGALVFGVPFSTA
jgi:hypothetical protein